MSLVLKDPAATVDYSINWRADYLGDDVLIGSSWSIEPDHPGGLSLQGDRLEEGATAVTLAGGRPGLLYRVANRISTAAGFEDCRSIVVRVETR